MTSSGDGPASGRALSRFLRSTCLAGVSCAPGGRRWSRMPECAPAGTDADDRSGLGFSSLTRGCRRPSW